jgi:hypothetical protein
MDLSDFICLFICIFIFACGFLSGHYTNLHKQKPAPAKEIIEVVYEKDCYIEFEDREYKVKRLSIDDLK